MVHTFRFREQLTAWPVMKTRIFSEIAEYYQQTITLMPKLSQIGIVINHFDYSNICRCLILF